MSPINKSSHHTTNNTKRNRASSFPPSDEQQISWPAVDVTIPLYRPANSCEEIDELFTRQDLTEHDILVFLSGGTLPTKSDHDDDDDVRKTMRREFHQRREEIRKLAEQLKSGEARIDEDGRLVLNDPPRPPRANLPPPPLPGHNNHANNNHLIDDPLLGNGAFPEANPDGGGANLTIRRICFAVLAVVTAFVCVILQTLPLMELTDTIDTHFDPLLHELMHIKFLRQHLKNCPDLDRHPPTLPSINASNIWSYRFWQDRLWQVLGLYSETNCDDGVIHIPAKHVLTNNYMYSSPEEAALLEPFRYGVDKIWRIPCHQPPMDVSATSSSPISRCYPGWNTVTMDRRNETETEIEIENECPNMAIQAEHACFRGVHDDIISMHEVDQALGLGNHLILTGGDHFDVYYDVSYLNQRIPSVVSKLQRLLRERYNQYNIQPVAFRIHTAGPMDFYGVNLFQGPALTLNQTVSTTVEEILYTILCWITGISHPPFLSQ